MTGKLLLPVLALLLFSSASLAQGGRGGGRRGAAADTGAPRAQRQARLALERLVRNQVRPTDAQMRQLQAIDSRFEEQRIQLNRDELQLRQQLRRLMLDTVTVEQDRIGETLDKLVKVPSRRAALLEAEQKELAGILTPLQRARYQAIQEQVRRTIERGRGGPPPGPPGPPPPGG